jgi:hypothetical protein
MDSEPLEHTIPENVSSPGKHYYGGELHTRFRTYVQNMAQATNTSNHVAGKSRQRSTVVDTISVVPVRANLTMPGGSS